ncbi:MAG: hypothetical protein ACPHK8_03370 [Thermoplasmatota archaeon]
MRYWFLAFALAGCVSTAPPAETTDPQVIETLPFNLFGCDMLLAGATPNFADVAHLVPPGYEPADAAQFLDLPAPVERALVAVLIGKCDSFEEQSPLGITTGWVLIEPPLIDGGPSGDALNFYQVYSATDSHEARAHLDKVDWRTNQANISFNSGSTGGQITASVSDANIGLSLSALRTSQTTPLDDARTFRLWERHESGTQLLELSENSPGELSRGTCVVQPGSWSETVLGTACDDFGQSLLYFPLFDANFPSRVSVYPTEPR